MKTKKIQLLLMCLLIFSMFSTVCYADEVGRDEDSWAEDKSIDWVAGKGKGAVSGTGTDYTFTQGDISLTVSVPAGSTKYGLTGFDGSGLNFGPNYTQDENGEHHVTVDQAKAALSAIANDPTASAEDRANAAKILAGLENETNTFWTQEATITIGGVTATAQEWDAKMTELYGPNWATEHPNGSANPDDLLFAARAIINSMNALTDIVDGKIVYGEGDYEIIFADPTGTITGTPSGTPSETPSQTPSTTPSTDPSNTPPTPTPTVTPPPPTPTPVQPDEEYVLEYSGQADCWGADVKTTAKIDDTKGFGVAEGGPIPTSEELILVGETNWLANLVNIQRWQLRVTKAVGKTASATYVKEIRKVEYDREEVESGDETIVVISNYSDTVVTEAGEEVDTETHRVYYYAVYDTIGPEGVDSEKLVGQTLGYTYIGDSYIDSGSEIVVNNDAIGGEVVVAISTGASLAIDNVTNCIGPAADPGRVSINDNHFVGTFLSYAEARSALDAYKAAPKVGDYFGVATDGAVLINGRAFGCNQELLTTQFGYGESIGFSAQLIDKIPLIPNKSAGTFYETYYAYHKVGSRWIDIPDINDVRVQTPIHDELTIETASTNQLENGNLKPAGEKIVRIDDEFVVKVKIWGSSVYYSGMDYVTYNRIIDYATKIEFSCGVCGFSDDITAECKGNNSYGPRGEYHHPCKADINKVTDLTSYPITSTVWVENYGKGGPDRVQPNLTNNPDDYYVLRQNTGVFVVGKLYDLEVRAVDDVGWKLKLAEKLSNLPTGEEKDNKITTYKYGLKLGYRAYFDLKTLGTASKEIEIKPNIYYVKTNGTVAGKVGEDVSLWFKTTDGRYNKLGDSDLVISMVMNNTRGEEYNDLFKEETLKMFNKDKSIDYNKALTIGGLLGIELSNQNSTVTKYLFKDGVTFAYTTPEENSRRWYGEVYLPSSTVVAKPSASEKDIANGKNTYTEGYLLVTFKPIETTTASGAKYLKYDEIRDFNWRVPTDPLYAGDTTTPVLIEEKGTKGTASNMLKLPNGRTITNLPADFYETEAPIVIYDVSLKANDDMEISGTH